MSEAVTYPRPVSRAAYDVFARDNPFGAQLILERGRICIVDEQKKVDEHGSNVKK